MKITILMILTYIACCVRIGTAPWKYFQINARYFSNDEGIFSKLRIDKLIPARWRLPQAIDDGTISPENFPVFLKPEWGQNAHGIHRVENSEDLQRVRAQLRRQPKRYMLQSAAPGMREFEVFSIDSNRYDDQHDVLTVTEAINNSERFPINSKYNRNTQYRDITEQFSATERHQLSRYISEIGRFGISRMSVRADSIDAMLQGKFHVIEINLFLPMPINLLDTDYTLRERLTFIGSSMMSLARATKAIEPVEKPQAIFTKMMLYGRQPKRSSIQTNRDVRFTQRPMQQPVAEIDLEPSKSEVTAEHRRRAS
ncbi:MAG: hypothetical protein KTR35_09825 [Gammaproteobacteria bacterium]|nr:hypothetical protein [Gammaproteobacteria bacterium]